MLIDPRVWLATCSNPSFISPSSKKRDILTRLYRQQVEVFRKDADGARRLLSVGDSPATAGDAAEMAAWTVVAGAILNMDESVTKG